LTHFNNALEIEEKMAEGDVLDIASLHSNIGSVYLALEDYGNALAAHQRALEICESVLGSQDIKVAYLYYTVGHLHYDIGDNKKAIENLTKAYNIYLAINGAEHNDTQTVQELIEHIKKKGNNH
jgi:tetratricopeptide (TPR) repeat protein